MSDNDLGPLEFDAFASGPGTPFGGLQDPTGMSVSLAGFSYGAEVGWEWFRRAAEAQREALTVYVRLLRAAAGDVTDPRVKAAAVALHASVDSLPLAHAAYAGVGFPSPDAEATIRDATEIEQDPAVSRGMADRLHPFVDTALRGSRLQRYALAGEPALPVEVELILARDPAVDVRRAFVSTGARSRSAMLLMERDEAHNDIRELLADQPYASVELKLDQPIAHRTRHSLEGAADLLGVDDVLRESLRVARNEARERRGGGPTLREVLEAYGWTQSIH